MCERNTSFTMSPLNEYSLHWVYHSLIFNWSKMVTEAQKMSTGLWRYDAIEVWVCSGKSLSNRKYFRLMLRLFPSTYSFERMSSLCDRKDNELTVANSSFWAFIKIRNDESGILRSQMLFKSHSRENFIAFLFTFFSSHESY